MNSQVRKYYRKFGEEGIPFKIFHDVIALHEEKKISWEEAYAKAPGIPKGWFELARLSAKDRVDFTRDFWLGTLPFVPHVHDFLNKFFLRLDDVCIFLIQEQFDTSYRSELVYSLRDGTGFFRGCPPLGEEEIHLFNRNFQETLPASYLAFLRIHDGFCKSVDRGCIPSIKLSNLSQEVKPIRMRGSFLEVNPSDLFPFYESYDEKNYQCFYAGWIPDTEMGNVFYTAREQLISDISNPKTWAEELAFPSFLDWLIFYMEGVEN